MKKWVSFDVFSAELREINCNMASGSTTHTLDRAISILKDKNDRNFTEIGGNINDSDCSILSSKSTSKMAGIIGRS